MIIQQILREWVAIRQAKRIEAHSKQKWEHWDEGEHKTVIDLAMSTGAVEENKGMPVLGGSGESNNVRHIEYFSYWTLFIGAAKRLQKFYKLNVMLGVQITQITA